MESFVYKYVWCSHLRSGPRNAASRRSRRSAGVVLACALLVGLPATSQAGATAEMSKQAGLGAASAITSLVYAPVKMVYALGGLIVGGLAWGFSGGDNQVAKVVLTPSILGDYVVTPKQLVGDEPIEFFGRDPEYQADELEMAVASPPPEDRVW